MSVVMTTWACLVCVCSCCVVMGREASLLMVGARGITMCFSWTEPGDSLYTPGVGPPLRVSSMPSKTWGMEGGLSQCCVSAKVLPQSPEHIVLAYSNSIVVRLADGVVLTADRVSCLSMFRIKWGRNTSRSKGSTKDCSCSKMDLSCPSISP